MRVVGVDGCRGGWVAVVHDVGERKLHICTHTTMAEIVAEYDSASCVAVDMPIGLPEGEPRLCDIEARKVLGSRRSSVFPAPNRRLLEAAISRNLDYAQTNEMSRGLYAKGLSRQAFGIFPKIAEVDRLITPALQDKLIEIHPEVSFSALAGRPMTFRKSKPEGFDERRGYLAEDFETINFPSRHEARRIAPPAQPDDLLDAIVAAWSAERFAEGNAERLPQELHTDSRGLRMEIVY